MTIESEWIDKFYAASLVFLAGFSMMCIAFALWLISCLMLGR